jgi:hypothetical protein
MPEGVSEVQAGPGGKVFDCTLALALVLQQLQSMRVTKRLRNFGMT